MGAWSHEPFGNDSACDWASDLDGTTDFSVIETALDEMIEAEDDYLDADLGSAAIAAAEVLAKVLGQATQSEGYPDGVDEWLDQVDSKPATALLQKAQRALELVLTEESELYELWMESEEYMLWQESVFKLQAALLAA